MNITVAIHLLLAVFLFVGASANLMYNYGRFSGRLVGASI